MDITMGYRPPGGVMTDYGAPLFNPTNKTDQVQIEQFTIEIAYSNEHNMTDP